MQKTYVLDTNVLIQSPRALLSFEDNRIVLPLAVLEELDALKTADGERGANARACIRMLAASGRQSDGGRAAPWRRFAARGGQLCGCGAAARVS